MEENNKFSSNLLKISTIAPSNSNKSKEPSEEFKLSKKLTMVNKNKNDTNSLILLDNITDKNSSSLVKKNTLFKYRGGLNEDLEINKIDKNEKEKDDFKKPKKKNLKKQLHLNIDKINEGSPPKKKVNFHKNLVEYIDISMRKLSVESDVGNSDIVVKKSDNTNPKPAKIKKNYLVRNPDSEKTLTCNCSIF